MTGNNTKYCVFEQEDLTETLQRYDSLSIADYCPHISKVESRRDGVLVYAIMDSNCNEKQQALDSKCVKQSSSSLRLAARKDVSNRNQSPQELTFLLQSHNQKYLKFKDGKISDNKSILDLRATDVRLRVGALYRKNGPIHADHDKVDLEMNSSHDFKRVSITIDVFVLKQSFKGHFLSRSAELSVAIFPSLKSIDPVITRTGGLQMQDDLMLSSVILEAVNLLFKDGYEYIKNVLTTSPNNDEQRPSVHVEDKQITLSEISKQDIRKLLQDIDNAELSAGVNEITGYLDQYKVLQRKKNSFSKFSDKGTTTPDNANMQFHIGEIDVEIEGLVEKIYNSINRLRR